MQNRSFADFLAAVRQGESDAVEAFVRTYEPYVRRVVRIRLRGQPLARLFDSADICQSVLALFLRHAAAGRFELHSHADLRALLKRMAINRFLDKLDQDRLRPEPLPKSDSCLQIRARAGLSPERQELLQQVRAHLTAEERWLAEEHLERGRRWEELAAERGVAADTLRMRLRRALARVQKALQKEGIVDAT